MRILGIDPGYSGGLALMDGTMFLECEVMPVITLTKSKRAIDEPGLRQLIIDWKPDHVVVEKVSAMPKQGVVSMFNFGTTYGIIRGILAGLEIPYTLVAPRTWQKVMFADIGKKKADTKKIAKLVCKRLWPGKDFTKSDRAYQPHDGKCDAALIAEWGRRTLG
jgi:crossover junction endodeoxyribonuclease RuvC